MTTIRLTQDAYIEGGNGAFYRFTTEDGKASVNGIWGPWYMAEAVDDNGNEYRVVWAIANEDAFNDGDEDCCDWDNPDEIYSYELSRPVEAKIEW